MRSGFTAWSVLAALLLATAPVRAQDDDEEEDEEITDFVPAEVERVEAVDGWSGQLTLGGTVNVGSNANVVGQRHGMTALLGVFTDSELTYLSDRHEWNITLFVEETFTRSPGIDNFVKSNDELQVATLYNLFLWGSGGLFARASVETPLFATTAQSPEQRSFVDETADEDDEDEGEVAFTDSFKLSDGFRPLTLEEAVGLFIEPADDELFRLSVRLGFGGRHTFGQGSWFVSDEDSEQVLLEPLEDVHQGGVEFFAGIEGEGQDGRLQYFARTTVLWPILNNDEQNRDSLSLTRVAFQVGTTAQLFPWLDIRYRTEITRDKQLVDAIQVAHRVTANLTFQLSHRTEEEEDEEEEDEEEEDGEEEDGEEEGEEEKDEEEDAGADKGGEDNTGKDGTETAAREAPVPEAPPASDSTASEPPADAQPPAPADSAAEADAPKPPATPTPGQPPPASEGASAP